MKRFFFPNVIAISLIFSALMASDECGCKSLNFLPLYKASIGPEVYHVKRTREGGTSQTGTAVGVRGSFERIGRYKWYVGVEGLYGSGTIKGHSGNDLKLKSKLTDRMIEGRAGYTFQSKCGWLPSFTPFVGYGYFEELNHYKSPSPLLVKFKNRASYCSFGFLSSVMLTQELTVGFNFKGRSLVDPECLVRNDPVFDRLKMHIEDELQYRLELPIYYDFFSGCQAYELGVVPFYEYRHYGRRENYPFDFLDTKLKIYGVNIQFTYRF